MGTHKVVALVPAAGRSMRMGGGSSKLLRSLGNSTVIEHTVQALFSSNLIDEIVLLVCPDEEQAFRGLPFDGRPPRFAHGGESRQRSVSKGLEFLRSLSIMPEYILIHDGARCLLSTQLVQRCIQAAIEFQAVSAAVPMIDTVKIVDREGVVRAGISRDSLHAIQTPQVFRSDLIIRAHQGARSEATDDASLVEPFFEVRVVQGERENFKITTEEDLQLAERVIRARARSSYQATSNSKPS